MQVVRSLTFKSYDVLGNSECSIQVQVESTSSRSRKSTQKIASYKYSWRELMVPRHGLNDIKVK